MIMPRKMTMREPKSGVVCLEPQNGEASVGYSDCVFLYWIDQIPFYFSVFIKFLYLLYSDTIIYEKYISLLEIWSEYVISL